MLRIGASSHGESHLRMLRVVRRGDRHDARDLTVGCRFEGDFADAFVEGKSAGLLPGEALKSLVHATARQHAGAEIERFGLALCERLLTGRPAPHPRPRRRHGPPGIRRAAVDAAPPAAAGKPEGGRPLVIQSDFEPKGDQPTAIADLVEGVRRQDRTQVLLGVTGSGKTFTMAKVIEATQRPALVLAPNKTLAAQLYGEFRSFFPDNAVEYFVSYYDYYQPEAYVPRTDTYIEKESSINEQSTACATARRALCSSATTSSSWRRCRASTASVRSRPIRP